MPRHFDILHAYWHSLAEGEAPDHNLVEPEPILDLLPYLFLAEFEENPFRVRYRLSGSKLDYICNINMSGRYLDEFSAGCRAASVALLTGYYARARDTGQPVYGVYDWPDRKGEMRRVDVAVFPLKVNGVVGRCLSIESYGFELDQTNGAALDPRLPIFD